MPRKPSQDPEQVGANFSRVFLVGAGPGDPDLITVKGLDLLERCDVLVYDSLVPPELIERSPAAEKHYVGKTLGGHAMPQDEITSLLVRLAKAPGPPRTIVRLKGGDPYVFGRGGEEAITCARAGIPVEVVPGVTAGIAALAYAGVPVTHRGLSKGVVLLTGHKARGGLPDLPWRGLVDSGLSLVFYMGVTTLSSIARKLILHGMDPDTPAITVQEGTLPGQRQVTGPLHAIARLVTEHGIRPPAITAVGSVAGLSPLLSRQLPRPLAGRIIVFLRAEERHYSEISQLRSAGARVLDIPGIRFLPLTDTPRITDMMRSLEASHVVLLTSSIAAEFFSSLLHRQLAGKQATNSSVAGWQPVMVPTSPSVSSVLVKHGWEVTIQAGTPGWAASLESMISSGLRKGTPVWMPRSTVADDQLPEAVRKAGFLPLPVPIYSSHPVPLSMDVRSMLVHGRVDALVFLAPSCVESVTSSMPEILKGLDTGRTIVAALGPKTRAAITRNGLSCHLVPSEYTVPALVKAILRYFEPGSS